MGSTTPNFTPADLVRSVNKRMRQTYLKKRLLTTYKALDRMSQSGFNLEKLKDAVKDGELSTHPELIQLLSSTATASQPQKNEAVASTASSISQLVRNAYFLSSTVWKFQDFPIFQILREINFVESRSPKLFFPSFRCFEFC